MTSFPQTLPWKRHVTVFNTNVNVQVLYLPSMGILCATVQQILILEIYDVLHYTTLPAFCSIIHAVSRRFIFKIFFPVYYNNPSVRGVCSPDNTSPNPPLKSAVNYTIQKGTLKCVHLNIKACHINTSKVVPVSPCVLVK